MARTVQLHFAIEKSYRYIAILTKKNDPHYSVTCVKWVICPGWIRDVPTHLNTTCVNYSTSNENLSGVAITIRT
jgi:hypothetical protein